MKPHEAATIIGMLAANTLYNPRLHPDNSIERRNTVLNRMVAQGFLTGEQGQKYRELPLELNYRVLDKNNGPAPYFMEVVRRGAEKKLEELYGDSINLYRDGLRIYTTLNAHLQDLPMKQLIITWCVCKMILTFIGRIENHGRDTRKYLFLL